MRVFSQSHCRVACLALIAVGVTAHAKKPTHPPPPVPPTCTAPQPSHVLFLDAYPQGRFYLAVLPCLSTDAVELVSVREIGLDLPRSVQRKFQVANADVFFDGTRRHVVFGGRTGPSDYWGVYHGVLNLASSTIESISPFVSTPLVREEDPRFSSDGQWIVYKRDGEIWRVAAQAPGAEPSLVFRQDGCELWAPSMYANVVAYVRRCDDDPQSDRIVYHPDALPPVLVQSTGGGPDRFAHFTQTGDLVYSHVDSADDTASLWMYTPGASPFPLHRETTSDDDAYAERNGNEYIAFSGWNSNHYDLYVYRRTPRDAVQITSAINVLGPVLID